MNDPALVIGVWALVALQVVALLLVFRPRRRHVRPRPKVRYRSAIVELANLAEFVDRHELDCAPERIDGAAPPRYLVTWCEHKDEPGT